MNHHTQNLSFIPESGTAPPRGALRDLIRSNGGRQPRRRPKKPSQRKLRPRIEIEEDWTAAEFKQINKQLPFRPQNRPTPNFNSLPRSPAANSTDPFDALPISDAGNSQLLVYHCESVTDVPSKSGKYATSSKYSRLEVDASPLSVIPSPRVQ